MTNKSSPVCVVFSLVCKVRVLHRFHGIFHVALLGVAVWGAVIALDACPRDLSVACIVTAAASAIRLLWMLGSAVSQAVVASTMQAERHDTATVPSPIVAVHENSMVPSVRQKRRIWYVRWLWWGRFGAFLTLLQLVGAAYLTFSFVKNASNTSNRCFSDAPGDWHRGFFLALALAAWLLTLTQCCIGPDILAWSSLYARHSDAWRAYYHEMFDYGIREALCCLGRAQYITRDGDEVDSVAAVLGDLVSYRAAGASHLEFLAGLALLQLEGPSVSFSGGLPAPAGLMKEATILHPFAVAAYTGPLLDVGRNPLTFLCVWLHRQGLLTPWNRHRRPKLEGDNWWRGHAAAFLRHSRLPSEALRQGRVHQAKRECAYFVIVVHELRSVVVAVRGTETPEDLLIDGLGRESMLTDLDLIGVLRSERIPETVKQHLRTSKPHFAHEGIIDAARELALQLDDFPEDANGCSSSLSISETKVDLKKENGLLSTLLGPGRECEGYALRFVGHSLGGSIAALTALRLLARYPELHVYGYGVLPCVDAPIADACSSFVTSIVYNDEFSSRLSVSSIRRLRVAAVKALAAKSSSDSGTITSLARRLLGSQPPTSAALTTGLQFTKEVTVGSRLNVSKGKRVALRLRGGLYLCSHACRCLVYMSSHSSPSPPNLQLSDLSRCRPQRAHSSEALEYGLHEEGIQPSTDDLCYVKSFMYTGDHGNLVSVSAHSAANDLVSDKENVCVDAGRDGDKNDEESEALIMIDNIGRCRQSSDLHIKPEEDENQNSMDEDSHKGKAPLHCDSPSDVHASDAMCANISEENNYCEMFMPGLIVHIVPASKSSSWHSWDFRGKKVQEGCQHRAFIKDRRSFQDLVISASMFLDHMPWRCQYALNKVLESEESLRDTGNNCSDSLV